MKPFTLRGARGIGFLAGALAAAGLAALVLTFWSGGPGGRGGQSSVAHAAGDQKVPVAWRRPAVSADGLAARTGVRIVRVVVSGDGGLLDLRYQVVDPNRAVAVHEAGTPPAIVDERTGLVIDQLFMGHAHNGPLKTAVTYYLVFENPGEWVHRGGKVTVLLGNAQVEHVVVN